MSSRRLNLERLENRALLAADPYLLADINRDTDDSFPDKYAEVNGDAYFMSSGNFGDVRHVWRSDGTAAGTTLLQSFEAGSANQVPDNFTNLNGTLYFTARGSLWKSDGTAVGTTEIRFLGNLPPPKNLTNVNGTLFMAAAGDSGSTLELWKSDGTPEGTVLVKDIKPGIFSSNPVALTNVNGTLFFAADDGIHGVELWKSDGTSAGTVMVADLNTDGASHPSRLVNVNGTLFFAARDENSGIKLWKSDGQAAGTVLVKDSEGNAFSASYLTNINGMLLFRANDGTGSKLWKSDGTAAGTLPLSNINANDGPTQIVNANGTIYFDGGAAPNIGLWKSDGTPAGTKFVSNMIGRDLTAAGNRVFFAGKIGLSDEYGEELWTSDGTAAGTVMVEDIFGGSRGSYPGQTTSFANINGRLFFTADDGTHGHEPWISDGTAAGTRLIKDINAITLSSAARRFTEVSGSVFFTAGDGSQGSGNELWKTNGTTAGTALVKDLFKGRGFFGYPNSGSPSELTNLNGTLYFNADDGIHGSELWKSDGTAAGTELVKDIEPDQGVEPFSSAPRFITNVNGTLFFAAFTDALGTELWKSDGTAEGTVLVKDVFPGERYNGGPNHSAPLYLTNLNGTLFFSAKSAEGRQLWKSDGTAAGTVLVKDINPASSSDVGTPAKLTVVGNLLYFTADDGINGIELWKSDGTAAGTMLVENIRPGSNSGGVPLGSNIANLTPVRNLLYFTADNGTDGIELWRSNGTASGTFLVKDIRPEVDATPLSSNPTFLTNVNGTLYFAAENDTAGRELWRSGGTAASTLMVKDIFALNKNSSTPSYLTNVAGTLYFAANDGVHGSEFWKSDGTAAGTVLMQDLWSGPGGSYPHGFANLKDTLYFLADNGLVGRSGSTLDLGSEPWVFNPANDAPVLDNRGVMRLRDINEDDRANIGTRVVDIIASAGGNRIVDPDPGALEGIAIVGADTTHGSWQYSTDGGATWRGIGAVSATSARLLATTSGNRLRFLPQLNFNGRASLSFRAWDRTSGVNGTLASVTATGGSSALSTAVETAWIQVRSVNDAPRLNIGGDPYLNPINEDQPVANNPGTTIPNLLARGANGDPITDVDIGAVEGIAIVAAARANGKWQFSLDAGTSWSSIGAVSSSTARLLAATNKTRLRFVPHPDFNGTATITFRAWDRSSGVNGALVSITSFGGITAFSSARELATITVQPVAGVMAQSPGVQMVQDSSAAGLMTDQSVQDTSTMTYVGITAKRDPIINGKRSLATVELRPAPMVEGMAAMPEAGRPEWVFEHALPNRRRSASAARLHDLAMLNVLDAWDA